MLIDIIAVGKLKNRGLQAGCDEFLKWISPYAKTAVRLLPDSDTENEGRAILKALERERNAEIIALSEEGREYSSPEFASMLGGLDRKAVFVIGGPFGLAEPVKRSADLLFSLSRLTFTHEIARFLLCEQLFRAVNILHGGGYHK